MVYSMTGYGRGRCNRYGIEIMVEIKTVNHRYRDIFFRLPRDLHSWEEPLRKKVMEKIHRGRIDITATLEEVPQEAYDLKVNDSLVLAYARALEKVKSLLSLEAPLTLDHLLSYSELFSVQSSLAEKEEVWEVLEKALQEALQGLLLQREKEGEVLREELESRCARLQESVAKIKEASPRVVEHQRRRLRQRLSELLEGDWDESRVLTECALIAERSNTEEELTRARSHLQSFREALRFPEPVGRRLDFIIQELIREINTVGSKAGDYEIAGLVVEAKAELEKMREQVQNIE